MTVREFVTIHCDHPGCRKTWPDSTKPHPSSWQFARQQMLKDGWTESVPRGRDFCPDHKRGEQPNG